MPKFQYPDSFSTCPYCGEKGKPCSEITSMARAYARDACKKLHGGVPVSKENTGKLYDPEPDL
jgi:hypothetical protein